MIRFSRWFLAFFLFLSLFAGMALSVFAQAKDPKAVAKQLALDPMFLGLIWMGVIVIVGGIKAAEKFGLIKTPTDKAIQRMNVALNILMPEDVPLNDTAFYRIIASIKKMDPDRMSADMEKLAKFAEIHAQQQRKQIRLLTFLAGHVGGEEWKTFQQVLETKDWG